MQNSQVSTWVPILVAIIGIIGIIAGQIVNGWRDSRLWRREKEKEEAKLKHSDILDWRKTRIEEYSPIIRHLNDLESSFARFQIQWPESTHELAHAARETMRLYRLLANDVDKLELIGSAETADVSDYMAEILGNIAVILDHIPTASSDAVDDDPESINNYLNKAHAIMKEDFPRILKLSRELKDQFRKDLGISKLKDQEG